MPSILVEGWRLLPHSYAIINAQQCGVLLDRPDIALYHKDTAYFSSAWRPIYGALPRHKEDRIAAIPAPPPGLVPDIVLRYAFPYNLAPAAHKSSRLFVFGTSEYMNLTPEMTTPPGPIAGHIAAADARIITCSNWSRMGFIKAGAPEDRVYVVPAGIDPAVFHPLDPVERDLLREQNKWKDTFVFLNIGGMSANKGVSHLLKAFAQVCRRHPQARLCLKGLDSLYASKDMLGTATKALTPDETRLIKPRVIYTGSTLSPDAMSRLYATADCYVSPYLAEGFNMPVLEAGASGTPVICTSGGSTDDFTSDSFRLPIRAETGAGPGVDGVYLNPSLDSLVSHMCRVIEDPSITARARVAGPAYAQKHFTWPKVTGQLIDVVLGRVQAGPFETPRD